MHVAHSTSTPSVTLFSHREPMRFFLTERCRSIGLQSPGGASEIAPREIERAIRRQLAAIDCMSESEVDPVSMDCPKRGDSGISTREFSKRTDHS